MKFLKKAAKGKTWHAKHFSVPSGKKDSIGKMALRFSVACAHLPGTQLNFPIWMSLECAMDKKTGKTFKSAPGGKEVVDQYLTYLKTRAFYPRRTYADRRFCSYPAFDAFLAFKRETAAKGHRCDFQVPAIRWGAQEEKKTDMKKVMTKKGLRNFTNRRATVAQLIEHGDVLANIPLHSLKPLPRRLKWHYRPYTSANEDACHIPAGMTFMVVRVPKDDLDNHDNASKNQDGTFNFGTWTTETITKNNAYDVLRGYRRRNNIEAQNETYRRHFDIMRSPDIRIRVLSFGLALILMSIWAVKRVLRSRGTGTFSTKHYSFGTFLLEIYSEQLEAFLRFLDSD